MSSIVRAWAVGVLTALSLSSLAQDERAEPPTNEQRLAALEAAVATLDTRLALETARGSNRGGRSDLASEARIMALERTVDRLAGEVQRIERLADSAARAASNAQRDAMRAEQAARDAALRSR